MSLVDGLHRPENYAIAMIIPNKAPIPTPAVTVAAPAVDTDVPPAFIVLASPCPLSPALEVYKIPSVATLPDDAGRWVTDVIQEFEIAGLLRYTGG